MIDTSILLLIIYASLSMSRRYYYVVLFYMFSKSTSKTLFEAALSFLGWCVMLYLFYNKSILFLLLKMIDVISTYLINSGIPNRQSETYRYYFERVTVAANSNVIEASQFECFVDILLFAIFWGINYV